ncbi:MAG: ammonium transporter [Gemmatimonadetes bacterium]|nr:ammonium transporter [Gemmatimonadota bacterium]MCY3942163.1 ammonium transporter [Gemmatimonadota bacterium]
MTNSTATPLAGRGLPGRVFRPVSVAFLAALLLASLPSSASASTGGESAFVFNTLSFLIWGALVMWMCAGFTMLESGSVRSKNASVICLKNVGLYSIAGISYFVLGYGLMYTDVGSFIGSLDWFYGPSPDELALLGGNDGATDAVIGNGYAVTSDWFFQMVFVATTASIVSGALAERVNLWAFFAFTAVLTTIIYPVVGAWTWGGGWLAERGFTDFAGSTIVHSTGGWAALAGALVVGPRWGKFRKDGSVKPTPPSNIPAVTLGVFILWLGWFGFNGGSQLALGSAADAVGMSNVIVNTNLAAAGGVIMAIMVSRPILGRTDLFAALNGAIAGLVAITAGPNIPDGRWAIVIGAVGALVCTIGLKVLERARIDDVVGAVPAHLFAGVWGTLAASIAAGADLATQLIGVLSVGAFVFTLSWGVWFVLEKTMGVRVSRKVEEIGQDAAELGIDAYPEFALMVDPEDGGDYRDP